MAWHVLPAYDEYERAREAFEWDLPERYNPAVDLLGKHADRDRVALRYESTDGELETYSFRDLDDASDRLAAGLATLGVEAGDRVAVVVPQRPENPLTHLACWKLGAISVPLTVLFGPDALQYRLVDSGARAVVVDSSNRSTVDRIVDRCPDLSFVVAVEGDDVGTTLEGDEPVGDRDDSEPNSRAGDPTDVSVTSFAGLLGAHEPRFEAFDATPSTPSAILYTSGSTGPPKGVLHGHALWLGRAAAARCYFDRDLDDATLWTPADWAWGAALGGTVFAAWHHGCTVVGWPRGKLDPDAAFDLLARHRVTKAFVPPTGLRLLMGVDDPAERYDLAIETVATAGEPLTPEVVAWVDETFEDVSINEFYGQTELNLVVGNSSGWFDVRPGSMGKPFPGYEVAVLDEETREALPHGEVGELAVRPGDRRLFFDRYWNRPEATAAKRTADGWFLTGDLVRRDDDGYCWFVSRVDDVILTSGYRVGPTEVEEAILGHEAVEQVGVVGVPDETRGEAIAAFVQPATDDFEPEALRESIRSLVRERLAAYEYPRHVVFVDELPTTASGKVRRRALHERDEPSGG